MHSLLRLTMVHIAVAVLVTAGWAWAQDKPDPKSEPSPATGKAPPAENTLAEAPGAATGQDSSPSSETGPFKAAGREVEPWELQVGERVWLRIQEYKRLQAMILERLELTAEDKKAINNKFAEIQSRMIEDKQMAIQLRPNRLWTPEELAELEVRLSEAQSAGDTKAAEKIQLEIARGSHGTDENLTVNQVAILDEVREVTRPELRESLDTVISRWTWLERGAPYDGPVRMLNRASRDPDLKLSDEQREAVRAAISTALNEIPTHKRSEANKKEAAEKAYSAVMKVLNNEQSKIVDRNIAAFQHQLQEQQDVKQLRLRYGNIGKNRPEQAKALKDSGSEE